MNKDKEVYDIALSFAGEDRAYVAEVALALKEMGIRVFMMTMKRLCYGGRIFTHTCKKFTIKTQDSRLCSFQSITKRNSGQIMKEKAHKLVHFLITENIFCQPGSMILRYPGFYQLLAILISINTHQKSLLS